MTFGGQWKHHWRLDENITLSYGIHDSHHWLRFPDLADFRISPNAQEIHCFPLPEIPESTIRHLLLDQVLPRCMAHQGHLMIHASAVKTPKGVVLFTGSSGAGKSTLAGYFHQSDYPAMSDDCMLIVKKEDHVEATSSYSGVRLWRDSQDFLFPKDQGRLEMAHYSSKKRILLSGSEPEEMENNNIAAIIFMSPANQGKRGAEISLESETMRAGYMELLKQIYQLDVTHLHKIAQHAESLGEIIQKIPLFRLSMPHDYSLLPKAKQLILENVVGISGDP